MFVRMLTAMAGDVSYGYGDVVPLETPVAEAWIAAGIAERVPAAAASEKAARDLQGRLAASESARAEAEADREALREQIAVLVAENAALEDAAKAAR